MSGVLSVLLQKSKQINSQQWRKKTIALLTESSGSDVFCMCTCAIHSLRITPSPLVVNISFTPGQGRGNLNSQSMKYCYMGTSGSSQSAVCQTPNWVCCVWCGTRWDRRATIVCCLALRSKFAQNAVVFTLKQSSVTEATHAPFVYSMKAESSEAHRHCYFTQITQPQCSCCNRVVVWTNWTQSEFCDSNCSNSCLAKRLLECVHSMTQGFYELLYRSTHTNIWQPAFSTVVHWEVLVHSEGW